MRALLISFIFFFFLQVLLGQLTWNENRRLTFADFRGEPHDSTSAAATYCGIETRVCKTNFWNGKITISVEAIFYPDTSWYLANSINELTLRHEQAHFDIAEWFARKLRKTIQEEIRTVNDYNRSFQAIYNKIHQEYVETQQAYDLDTQRGDRINVQIKWEMIIRSKLQSFNKFQNSDCQNGDIKHTLLQPQK